MDVKEKLFLLGTDTKQQLQIKNYCGSKGGICEQRTIWKASNKAALHDFWESEIAWPICFCNNFFFPHKSRSGHSGRKQKPKTLQY